jgi:hypothetical protein
MKFSKIPMYESFNFYFKIKCKDILKILIGFNEKFERRDEIKKNKIKDGHIKLTLLKFKLYYGMIVKVMMRGSNK